MSPFQDNVPVPGWQERPRVPFCSWGSGALPARTPQPPLPPPACWSPPGPSGATDSFPHKDGLTRPIATLPEKPTLPRQDAPQGRKVCSRTHSCLINRVVELRFYRDLAVGVGVHEGQAKAGVVPTPAGETQESLGCTARPQSKARPAPSSHVPPCRLPTSTPATPERELGVWLPRTVPGACGR